MCIPWAVSRGLRSIPHPYHLYRPHFTILVTTLTRLPSCWRSLPNQLRFLCNVAAVEVVAAVAMVAVEPVEVELAEVVEPAAVTAEAAGPVVAGLAEAASP